MHRQYDEYRSDAMTIVWGLRSGSRIMPDNFRKAMRRVAATVSVLSTELSGRRFGITRTVGVSQLIGAPLVLALAFIMVLPVAVVIMTVRQLALNLQDRMDRYAWAAMVGRPDMQPPPLPAKPEAMD